jgi:hypothetical protein
MLRERRRLNQIPSRERMIKSDSISGEEDRMGFDFRRGRLNQIPSRERKIKSDSMSGVKDKIRFEIRRGR